MGGCSFSRLRQKQIKQARLERASVEYSIDQRRKSQGIETRAGTVTVPRNCSIFVIYPHEDELIRQIKSAAETLGHRLTAVAIDYQGIYEWLKKYRLNQPESALSNPEAINQFPPKIHELFGNETILPVLELVIIDRRLPNYQIVADLICEYFRNHLGSGFDAIIVALLNSAQSSSPSDVLDSGIIQAGFSRLIYQSDLLSMAEICQELLMFQCHDISLLRRLRQLTNKHVHAGQLIGSTVSSCGRYGSNGYLLQLESRGSAPHLSRIGSTGLQTPPVGTTESSHSQGSAQPVIASSVVKNYVNKGRSHSISGLLFESGNPNQSTPQLIGTQSTVESITTPLTYGLMEPIVEMPWYELDEKSLEPSNVKEKEDVRGTVMPKYELTKSTETKFRRFSFDPSHLINSMTSKLGLSQGSHSRLFNSFTRADIDRLDSSILSDWANSVLIERESKLKQCQSYRKTKRGSRLTGSGPVNESYEKRKDSWARLNNFNMDSPLSQVVQLINSAQARSSSAVAKDLQKALEMMLSNDLFSGLLKTSSPNFDQTTADLIGGLMTNFKRDDKDTNKNTSGGNKHRDKPASADVISSTSPEIANCLLNEDTWNYDILALECVTNKKPLVHLGMKIFRRFNVMEFLHCPEQVMANWLQVIEEHYRPSNHYHNATHAADVMQTSSVLLLKDNIREILDPIDEVAMLLAAVIHDVDHPGRTNPFLVNSGHELAVLYNDLAVLESHHAALGFQLSKDDKVNIFMNLPTEEYRNLRKQIIDLVLATEMARHFEHVTKFVNNLSKPMMIKPNEEDDNISIQSGRHCPKRNSIGSTSSSSTADESTSSVGRSEPSKAATLSLLIQESPENKTILKRMLIKCCDVNNPTRPLEICKEWACRIAEEYFAQTDDEKRLGLPLVMPTFDRQTCNIAKSQTSFIDFFLKDMFAAWDVVCECPEIIYNLDTNYKYWNELMAKETASRPPS